MNKAITTHGLPAIADHEPKKAVVLTTNKIQPNRLPDVPNEARRRFKGQIITTHNLEQIQAENAKAAKKGGKKA